jgi:hypothetical protein
VTAPGTQIFTYWQQGKESTAGTTVAATRQRYGQGSGEVTFDDMLALHRGNRGTRTQLAYATSKGVAVQLNFQSDSEIGVGYDELPIVFSQLDGGNSAVGGAADKTWTIAPSQTGANSQESYTIEVGDDIQEFEFGYCQMSDFTISAAKDGMTTIQENWFARQPVKSTKTALSANTHVNIPGFLWAPKFATAQSGLSGASETLNFLQDFSVQHQTGLTPRFYQDGLAYFGQSVEALEQTATVTLHVESTALAVSEFYDKKRAQTVDFLQLSTASRGPSLGGSNYAATLQYALLWTDVKLIASVDQGVNIYEITGQSVIDPTWATNFSGIFVCALTALTA